MLFCSPLKSSSRSVVSPPEAVKASRQTFTFRRRTPILTRPPGPAAGERRGALDTIAGCAGSSWRPSSRSRSGPPGSGGSAAGPGSPDRRRRRSCWSASIRCAPIDSAATAWPGGDAGARPPRRARPALRAGGHRRAADAAGARVAALRHLSRLSRRARQRRLLSRRRCHHARRSVPPGRLPHRRLRRRVRPRPALGYCPGVRALLRRLRPVALRHGGRPRRRAAARQRGGGSGARLARRPRRRAVLRVGAPLRSAQPVHAARAVPVALSGDAAGRLRRRGGGDRRADRAAAAVARRPRPARRHHRRRGRRPRRIAGRARRTAARVLRLRRGGADPADRCRTAGAGPRRPRTSAHRRRDAHDPGTGRASRRHPPCRA